MLCACLVKKEPEQRLEILRNDGPLRMVYLNLKSRMQTFLQRQRSAPPRPLPDDRLVSQLFSDPANHSAQFRAVAFPPDGTPVLNPPWSMLELQTIASRVPCRSTNRSANAHAVTLPFVNPTACSQPMLVVPAMNASAMFNFGRQQSEDIGLQVFPRQRRPLEALLDRAVSHQGQPATMLALADAPAQPAQPQAALPQAAEETAPTTLPCDVGQDPAPISSVDPAAREPGEPAAAVQATSPQTQPATCLCVNVKLSPSLSLSFVVFYHVFVTDLLLMNHCG